MQLHACFIFYVIFAYYSLFTQETNDPDKEDEYSLAYDEFLNFYRKIAVRSELNTLFLTISNGNSFISLEQFFRFLQEEQNMVCAMINFICFNRFVFLPTIKNCCKLNCFYNSHMANFFTF